VIFAVLPVKNQRNAKQRLRDFLPAAERTALARLLYEQTLAELCQAEGIDQVVVATSDSEISAYARDRGALVLEEDKQLSHSASADAACVRCMGMGAKTVMLVPIDVPLVQAADFTELASAARPGLIVVPSADGTGTNAMVRTPPDIIQSRFGPGSCRAHLEQARSKGISVEVLRLRGLMFDIDTPEDVAWLLATAPDNRAATFLRNVCGSK
jgi:2-phospho-L-lactate guanylyltransferase